MIPRTDNFPYPQPAGLTSPKEDVQPSTNDTPNNAVDADMFAAFPGLTEGTIVNYCKTRNAVFQTWFEPYVKKIAELHRMFRNAPTASKAGKTVDLPVASGIDESINARLQPALLSRPKFVEALAQFVTEDTSKTQLVEDFVNQSVMEITRRPEKGKQAIKSAVVESMMIWRNVWRMEKVRTSEPVYVPDPNFMPNPLEAGLPPEQQTQPQMVYQGEQILEKEKSYWDWELVNPTNFAWDPHTVTRVSKSPWGRDKAQKSYNDLLRLQAEGMFKGVERLKFVVPKGASGAMKEGWEQEVRAASGDMQWNFTYADEKLYEVEEWWADMTWSTVGADGQPSETIQKKLRWFLVEGAYVVSIDDNPLLPQRLPWDSCPLIQDPHSLTGLSPLDVVRTLQKQINTYAGYQDTLAERMAKPTIFYDETSGISARTQFMRAYGMQPVQNVQGIKEMTLNGQPLQAVQAYITFLIGLMRESSGANEQFQGVEGADTATEFQGLVAAAGSRFADVVDTLSQGWLEALGNECYLHYKQFGVDGQMFARVAQTEGKVISLSRSDLVGDYTFVATSAATEKAKTQELGMAIQAVELGSKLPPSPDGRVYNAEKGYTEMILPLLNQKTGDDWFIQAPMPPMMPGAPGAMPPPQGMPPEMAMGAGPQQ